MNLENYSTIEAGGKKVEGINKADNGRYEK